MKTPLEKVVQELCDIFKRKRMSEKENSSCPQKLIGNIGTFDTLDLTDEVESAIKIESAPKEKLFHKQTKAELQSQVTERQVNSPTTAGPFVLPKADEEEQIVDSRSLKGFSIPMESDSELGVVDEEVKKWDRDWPITDHHIFLEIQKKLEEDPQLKQSLVSIRVEITMTTLRYPFAEAPPKIDSQ